MPVGEDGRASEVKVPSEVDGLVTQVRRFRDNLLAIGARQALTSQEVADLERSRDEIVAASKLPVVNDFVVERRRGALGGLCPKHVILGIAGIDDRDDIWKGEVKALRGYIPGEELKHLRKLARESLRKLVKAAEEDPTIICDFRGDEPVATIVDDLVTDYIIKLSQPPARYSRLSGEMKKLRQPLIAEDVYRLNLLLILLCNGYEASEEVYRLSYAQAAGLYYRVPRRSFEVQKWITAMSRNG